MNTLFKNVTTQSGNIRAAYNIKNDGNPVICFIHGAGGSLDQYMDLAEKITPECSFVAMDLPGHGKSDEAELSIENYAESVISVMKELSVESFVPVGHSMGGGIVLEIYRRASSMVSGMIFISTGSEIKVNDAVFKMIEKDFNGFANFAVNLSFSQEADEKMKLFMAEGFSAAGSSAVYRDFEICNTYNYTSGLSEIEVPVLVIAGSKDRMIPASVSEKLADSLKNSQMIIYDYSGHMPQCEMSGRVADDIINFAQKHLAER